MKRIFIDGLSGMAQGLFATLIIGTLKEWKHQTLASRILRV